MKMISNVIVRMLFIKTDNSLFLERVKEILNKGMSEWLEKKYGNQLPTQSVILPYVRKGLSKEAISEETG